MTTSLVLLDSWHITPYNSSMVEKDANVLGKMIKHQRLALSLTLQELAAKSGVSASHLGRIERGERFPSAHVLNRIAGPLSFREDQLFSTAGYLTPPPMLKGPEEGPIPLIDNRLDPFVARLLAQEPVEVQRAVIAILTVLKSIARDTMKKEEGEEEK